MDFLAFMTLSIFFSFIGSLVIEIPFAHLERMIINNSSEKQEIQSESIKKDQN